MKSILEYGERQAREMPSLRKMTPRIKAHYDTIRERMEQKQLAWGGDLSVINEDTWDTALIFEGRWLSRGLCTRCPSPSKTTI